MKQIALPVRYNMSLPSGETDLTAAMAKIREVRIVGQKIISAALAIEEVIVGIIKLSMFSELKTEKDFVTGVILKSDWCSFSAKRKLLLAAIDRYSLCIPKERNELDAALAKVMRYRNAFAHGDIQLDEHKLILKYFEGQAKTDVLNEEYWEKLEKAFEQPFDMLNAIEKSLAEKNG